MFTVLEKKIAKLETRLKDICQRRRALSSLILSITGMCRSLGPIVALMTRSAHPELDQNLNWEAFFTVNTECLQEFKFWRDNLKTHNEYAIKPHYPTSQIIFTNASWHSYRGIILKRLGKTISQSRFSQPQKETSSTTRELLAIKLHL